jgi:hypothetical protein
MQASFIDSLWEVGRQQEGNYHGEVLIARLVHQGGHREMFYLPFERLEEAIRYFQEEESGPGLYDPDDLSLLYSYDLPTGGVRHLYLFFNTEDFLDIMEALGNQVQEEDLPLAISDKVISPGDQGVVFTTTPTSAFTKANASGVSLNKATFQDSTVLFRRYNDIHSPPVDEPLVEEPFQGPTPAISPRSLYGVPSFRRW